MPSTVNNDVNRVQLLRAFSPRPILSYKDDRKFFTSFKKNIESTFLAIDTFENVLVIGDHGSGKTSLLNHISYQLDDDNDTILIKFSALTLTNFDQRNLLKKIVDDLRENSKKLRPKSDKILEGVLFAIDGPRRQVQLEEEEEEEEEEERTKESKDYSKLLDRFTAIIEHLKKDQIKVCIIIDDIDKIDSGLVWLTFRNIRDQIWKLKISIILTALPNQISEITKSPLDHFFSYWVKISMFDFKSTRELVKRRLDYAHSDIEIGGDAIEETLRRTGGNPRDILDIFRRVFESKKTSNVISRHDIENISVIFSNKLPSIEKEIFNYLVHNPNSSSSSADFVKKIGVSRSRIAQILSKLRKEGCIVSKQEGRVVRYYVTESGLERRKEIV